MLMKCFFVTIILASSETRRTRTYTLVGYTSMPSRVISCHNWGERVKTKEYHLPPTNVFGLGYSRLSATTIVIAIFNYVEFHTEFVKNTELSHLVLDEYSDYDGGKEYSKTFGYVTPCDFKRGCEHSSLMRVKLKISQDGSINARVQVYAAAWKSDTCAIAHASVDSFQVTVQL